MRFGFNAKWKSRTFEKCILTVIEDCGDEAQVMIYHGDTMLDNIKVTKSYIENNYDCIYEGFDNGRA